VSAALAAVYQNIASSGNRSIGGRIAPRRVAGAICFRTGLFRPEKDRGEICRDVYGAAALPQWTARADRHRARDYSAGYRQADLPIQGNSPACLLLWGRDDRIVPVALAPRLREAVSAVSCEVLPQCGHAPQEEQPDRTQAFLREALDVAHRNEGSPVSGARRPASVPATGSSQAPPG
jgi:pimeloyl-ACP methyl ester carboxylesterase